MKEQPINAAQQPQSAVNVSNGNIDLENVQLEAKGDVHIGPNIVQHFYPPSVPAPQPLINLALVLPRLQTSLRAHYGNYTHLERLFDNTQTPIAESFINLALIKETEHKDKEKGLAQPALEEKNDGGEKAKSSAHVDERLASHEQLYAVKESLALTELFESKGGASTPKKVLVLGRAGIGKSILCQYLTTQWASEEKEAMPVATCLQKKFDAVFWIKLREVAADTREGENLVDVLDRFCLSGAKADRPTKQELTHYLEKESNKVLFILDGYDEITEHRQLDRLLEEFNTHTNLLLTSRPIVIEKLGNQKVTFDRRLENMGFLNENIEAYIQQFMVSANQPEQAPLMLNFLKSDAGVWGIAHIPINLELLSWLWSKGELTLEQGQVITLSKLYQIIVDRIQEAYADKVLQQPDAMESKMGEDATRQVNAFLEYLAFSAMEKETLFISGANIRAALIEVLPDPQYNTTHRTQLLKSATNKLGFLRTTGQGGKSPLDQSHYFIHLSFQEFYAARYVARILAEQPPSQKSQQVLACIQAEKYTPRYQLMLWMSAGLLYQRGKPTQTFSALASFEKAIASQPRDLIGFHHRDLLMHCLDECEADPSAYQTFMQQHQAWLESFFKLPGPSATLQQHQAWFSELSDARNEYVKQLARCPVLFASKPVIDRFLQALKDKDEDVRYAAVEALSQLNNPSERVMAALLGAVKDENRRVRRTAVATLGKLNNPSEHVMAALLGAVKDKNSDVRRTAVAALGKMDNPSERVIAALLGAVKDKDEDVRYAAVEALSQLNNPSEHVMAALLGAVKDESEGLRHTAITALGKMNNPSERVMAAVLLGAVKDEHWRVRRAAVATLGKLNNPSEHVMAALLEMVKDERKEVRDAAVQVLGQLNNPSESVIAALLEMVKDEREGVREAAVAALGQLDNPSEHVMAALLGAVKDEHWSVKRTAVAALGKMDNSSEHVIAALLEMVKDEREEVREAAVAALGQLDNPSEHVMAALLGAVKDEHWSVKRTAVAALGKMDNSSEHVIAALLEMVKDEREEVREAAVAALGQLDNPSEHVMAALLGAVKDESEGVRKAAVAALGQLDNPSEHVMAALLGAVKDKNWSVRHAAVAALDKMDNPSEHVIAALLGAVKGEHWSVREAAVAVLGKMDNPSEHVMAALLEAAKDESKYVRCAAVEVLGQLDNPSESVIAALLGVLKDKHEDVRYAAVAALGKLDNPSERVIAALLEALLEPEWRVRGAAEKALGKLSSKRQIQMVFGSLTSPELCTAYFKGVVFKQNYLVWMDHANGQLIIRPGREIHCIPLPQAHLQYLEKQIIAVAKERNHPPESYSSAGYGSNWAGFFARSGAQSDAKNSCLVM